MLSTFFSLGGTEFVNGERLRGYSRSGVCPAVSITGQPCSGLRAALEDDPYTLENIGLAPWYDPQIPESAGFLGVEALAVSGISDTIRSVTSTQTLGDGQVFTSARKSGREVRFTVALFALDSLSMEYGIAWLSSVLDGSFCGQGGDRCSSMALSWFAACPTSVENAGTLRREMLQSVTTSGPFEKERVQFDTGAWMVNLEFTISSELPGFYSAESALGLTNTTTPTVVQEVLQNIAENARGRRTAAVTTPIELGRNLINNPSFETNTTGWTAVVVSGGGSAPTISRVANTGQLAGAAGSWLLLMSSPSGPAARLLELRSPLVTLPVGSMYVLPQVVASLTGSSAGGTGGAVQSSDVRIQFLDASSVVVGDYFLGPVDYTLHSGTGFDLARTFIPINSVTARLIIRARPAVSSGTSILMQLLVDEAAIFSGPLLDNPAEAGTPGTSAPYTVQWPASPVNAAAALDELRPVWAGTANASATRLVANTRAAEWSTTRWDGLEGVATLVSSGGNPLVRARGTMGLGSPDASTSRISYKSTRSNVLPGTTYYISMDFMKTGTVTFTYITWIVEWFNAAGTSLGETIQTPVTLFISSRVVTRLGALPIVAPAGAANVKISIGLTGSSTLGAIFVGNAAILPFQASGFFDGDSTDTPTMDYEWSGAQWDSDSTATPQESNVIIDPLADPSCPPAPAPPLPPAIDDPCSLIVNQWHRYLYTVASGGIPESLSFVPSVELSSVLALDGVRISVIPNPQGLPPEAAAGSDPIAYWELTYLPASIPISMNSLSADVSAQMNGSEVSADHLVIGRRGEPIEFPRFSCGQGYVLVVDVPYNGASPVPPPTFAVTGRREYV